MQFTQIACPRKVRTTPYQRHLPELKGNRYEALGTGVVRRIVGLVIVRRSSCRRYGADTGAGPGGSDQSGTEWHVPVQQDALSRSRMEPAHSMWRRRPRKRWLRRLRPKGRLTPVRLRMAMWPQVLRHRARGGTTVPRYLRRANHCTAGIERSQTGGDRRIFARIGCSRQKPAMHAIVHI